MKRNAFSMSVAALALTAAAVDPSAHAQCTGQWLPGAGVPGVNGTVKAITMWDRDGAGPQPPVLVAGGVFSVAGSVFANSIAVWDGAAWSTLGSGLGAGAVNSVNALAALPNGDLVAAGTFTEAGTTTVNRVARWNGTTWQPMGAGVNNTVNTLAATAAGDVIAGGLFTTADGAAANRLARWNAATGTWSAFVANNGSGANGVPGTVNALLVLPDGDILVGGQFSGTSGINGTGGLGRWTPATSVWSTMESTFTTVYSLARAPNGDIYAGANTLGLNRWNGSQWEALGDSLGGVVQTLALMPNGDVVVGGGFAMDASICVRCRFTLARWDGSSWTRFNVTEPNSHRVRVTYALMVMPDGQVAVGSQSNLDWTNGFNCIYPNESAPNGISRWDGNNAWSLFSSGAQTSGPVSALSIEPNGDVLAAGEFVTIEGTVARHAARLSGGAWVPIGDGVDTPIISPGMEFIGRIANGNVILGGAFDTINNRTEAASRITRFNGTGWGALGYVGSLPSFEVMKPLPDGDVIIAGAFSSIGGISGTRNIVLWDGDSNWFPLGDGLQSGVNAAVVLPGGDIIAGGSYVLQNASGSYTLARFNGAAWSGLDIQQGFVYAMLLLPDGDLVVGGEFTSVAGVPGTRRIARWNPATGTWSALGSGLVGGSKIVRALARMPNGDIVAAYSFATTIGMERWNGSMWSPFGPALDGEAKTLAVTTDGVLMVGGSFAKAGSQVSAYLARWADCVGVCCASGGDCTIARPGSPTAHCTSGTLIINGSCSPNSCSPSAPGACCSNTTCSIVTGSAACAGSYRGDGTACGAPGNPTTCCPANFNSVNGVTVQDVFDFLTAYFAGDGRADINGVGGVSIQDIFDFLTAWFFGCA